MRAEFDERGLYGPEPLLPAAFCHRFLQHVRQDDHPAPVDWGKGRAASSRAYYGIATHPAILDRVRTFLGDDVLLWGASIQSRTPGAIHTWHSDIEVTAPDVKTVAVWIGLRNTTPASSLFVVEGSHRFETIQQVRADAGTDREKVQNEDIENWARDRDPKAEVRLIGMNDGEALFFDGRMWHSSNNRGKDTRYALLLQYGTPESPIRIPDVNKLDWPFGRLEVPRPPCIVVSGQGDPAVNRIVPAPTMSNGSFTLDMTNQIYPLEVPLSGGEETWKRHDIFRGSTGDIHMSCHASTLCNGHSPHPPHKHVEEEILMMLQGEAELELPEVEGGSRRLAAGNFVFYPAWFPHTLRTLSPEPANYLMFKWRGAAVVGKDSLGFEQHDLDGPEGDQAFERRPVLDGSTRTLRKLHAHVSTLRPGGGYEPHVDAYDVAIVVLEGEVETLGQRVAPFGVVFYRAGEPHGMRNPTDRDARYVVFEFHGSAPEPSKLLGGATLQQAARKVARRLPGGFEVRVRRARRLQRRAVARSKRFARRVVAKLRRSLSSR